MWMIMELIGENPLISVTSLCNLEMSQCSSDVPICSKFFHIYISLISSLNWAVLFKIYVSPLSTMLFPMSETFKKSQLSEFFDVPAGCYAITLYYRPRKAIFSQASVILSTGGVSAPVHAGIHTPESDSPPPPRQAPRGRHPPGRHLPGRHPPLQLVVVVGVAVVGIVGISVIITIVSRYSF